MFLSSSLKSISIKEFKTLVESKEGMLGKKEEIINEKDVLILAQRSEVDKLKIQLENDVYKHSFSPWNLVTPYLPHQK